MFPTLVGHGLYGSAQDCRWIDIGTPASFLEANLEAAGERGLVDPAAVIEAGAQVVRLGGRAASRGGRRRPGCPVGGAGGRARPVRCDRGECRGQSPGSGLVDSKNIRGAIEQLPEQLREGGRIGVAAGERLSMPAAVVLAGMGGSAVGGELMRGIIAGSCPVPVTRVRGFGVPTFVGPGTLVVCTSYSGDTAETLACARQAHDRGASVLAVGAGGRLGELAKEWGAPFAQVPSGLFPRAALGYLFGATTEALAVAGLAPEGLSLQAADGAEQTDQRCGAGAGAHAGEHDPADLRRRAAGGGGLQMEDPAEREREDARLQPRLSRGGPQRDRGLGRCPGRELRRGVSARRALSSPRTWRCWTRPAS